jgi:hypothetical protein
MSTVPSCPRCGAECSAGAPRCRTCGFGLVDVPKHRRPSLAVAAAGLAGAAAVLVAILLAAGPDGSDPTAAPPPPAAVPALEAERRLELRFGGRSDDETAAVRCPRWIEPGRMVRCELRYADGIERAMLVRISPAGELEADIPYPATIRRR